MQREPSAESGEGVVLQRWGRGENLQKGDQKVKGWGKYQESQLLWDPKAEGISKSKKQLTRLNIAKGHTHTYTH